MKSFPNRYLTRLGAAPLALLTWLGLYLGAAGCASDVNLSAVPEAQNGCEAPTPDELNPEAPMLPGRHCIGCHVSGGQASRRAWTAAGTVFDSPTAKCNTQGLEGVKVEIADSNRKILITLYTNRSGNFFTAEPFKSSAIIARISKDGKWKEMQGVMTTSDCGSCHFPGGIAGGRIYLN